MNAALFLIIGVVVLIVGYIFYGGWLAKKWGVDNSRVTPAHELEDGKDYCPAKAPVLMGHHFSSIAGAGPINGPIQAAVFGWVPVMLWILIGGIFFGGVHDFGALFASIRHKGESIGEVIGDAIGAKAKKLFIVFAYLTLILVVAAFASIVANTFKATYTADGAVDLAASAANASSQACCSRGSARSSSPSSSRQFCRSCPASRSSSCSCAILAESSCKPVVRDSVRSPAAIDIPVLSGLPPSNSGDFS